MKRILLIILLTAACGLCNAQDALFRKYSNTKGVEIVFISKTMMRLVGNLEAGEMDISKIASKLDHIKILNCERPSLIPAIWKQAVDSFKKDKYEEMMKMSSDGEQTIIYMKSRGKGKNEFVLLTNEKEEISIVNILGNVTLSEIKNIMDN